MEEAVSARTLIIGDPGSNWRAAADEPLERAWERAKALIGHAAQAGLDVVKWQLLNADLMYQPDTPAWHLVKPYELPAEWLPALKEECERHGLEFACTVYDPSQVVLIDPLVKRHKVSSYECQHWELLRKVARTGKPTLVSMGTASHVRQVADEVVGLWQREKQPRTNLTFLHCVSGYPALLAEQQLALLADELRDDDYITGMRQGIYPGAYGFSDHTPAQSAVAAVVAVALGASVVEVHFRTEERMASPDCTDNARDPLELAVYVESIRQAEQALGDATGPAMGSHAKYKWNPRTGWRGQ